MKRFTLDPDPHWTPSLMEKKKGTPNVSDSMMINARCPTVISPERRKRGIGKILGNQV